MTCSRCGAFVSPDDHEHCFNCMAPLCGECWEEYGRCEPDPKDPDACVDRSETEPLGV